MNNNAVTIKLTKDGSPTLWVSDLEEPYHSLHGAFTESKHVFIKNGLAFVAKEKSDLNILEVGFGTGLNAILSFIFANENQLNLSYYAIEKNPIDTAISSQLDFGLGKREQGILSQFHTQPWDSEKTYNDCLTLHKLKIDLASYVPPKNMFDLIYFDAFAPEKQPELWTKDIFHEMYHSLNKNGSLVTYCAKGAFRRNLISCGFEIEKLPGPPGKREMTRATKIF